MTLTDPMQALGEQSSFVGYLLGLVGLSKVVRELADEAGSQREPVGEPDDFVHVLLGLASLGDSIEGLAEPASSQYFCPVADETASTSGRWMR